MKPDLSMQVSASAHRKVVRHRIVALAITVAAACAGAAFSSDALAQTCDEVMDRAAAALLAQHDLTQLSTAARVDLLYALATISPNQLVSIVTSPATSSLFRTPSLLRCEAVLRTLSGKFVPGPGDQRALEEAFAAKGWDPSIAAQSIRGNFELAQMVGYQADLIRIAQLAASNQPLNAQLQETWQGVTGMSAALRGFLCPMFTQAPMGLGASLMVQNVQEGIVRAMQQSSAVTSMVCF